MYVWTGTVNLTNEKVKKMEYHAFIKAIQKGTNRNPKFMDWYLKEKGVYMIRVGESYFRVMPQGAIGSMFLFDASKEEWEIDCPWEE